MDKQFKNKLKKAMIFFIFGIFSLVIELYLFDQLTRRGYSIFTAGVIVGVLALSFIVLLYLFLPKLKKRSELS